jgi:hypothetical protein
MKKLVAALTVLGFAAPVFACPNSDHDQAAAPKTAEKAKDAPKATPAPAPSKDPKAEPAKPADTAKKAPEKKPADKVSQK